METVDIIIPAYRPGKEFENLLKVAKSLIEQKQLTFKYAMDSKKISKAWVRFR